MADKVDAFYWLEVPIRMTVKQGEQAKEFERKMSICLSPPVEVAPHPVDIGVTLLTTQFGTKQVVMGYDAVMQKLRNG